MYIGVQKLDVEQAEQLERYVQALQYLNKQLAHLVGSYENISEVQQVLQVRKSFQPDQVHFHHFHHPPTNPPASSDPVASLVPPITPSSLSVPLSLPQPLVRTRNVPVPVPIIDVQAVEVESVNKACKTVENLKVKAQTDSANAGPTDERLLERLLNVRDWLSEPQAIGSVRDFASLLAH